MVTCIREADLDDRAGLERIETSADTLLIDRFAATNWPAAASGEERASMPGFILIACETEGGPAIGFAHVIELEDVAHLEQLAVLPEHGHRGHGRALVAAAIDEAARRGHHALTLRTYAEVPWNAPFYRSCGFRESEPETAFHRRLVAVEADLELDQYGPRLRMTVQVPLSQA
ncbi:GNAT family N-acetyltransferase [Plantibacter sp. Mn2098]|uniref:GNAT family N-acetyltransferase n=1 Tax=Plantibacter sp. Mn2098 TaxID=3395266 RepID=UPI003BC78FCE